jgi:N-dimethylarginine dimethylaminohydrolase
MMQAAINAAEDKEMQKEISEREYNEQFNKYQESMTQTGVIPSSEKFL